jgi:tetratricopeptide (TPR) repeat protein
VEAGRRVLERALAIAEASFGPRHFEVARIQVALGYNHYKMGNYGAAREQYERALGIYRGAFGPTHRWVGRAQYSLACIAALAGARDDAIATLRRTLETDWRWTGVLDDPDLDSLRGDPEADAILVELAGGVQSK